MIQHVDKQYHVFDPELHFYQQVTTKKRAIQIQHHLCKSIQFINTLFSYYQIEDPFDTLLFTLNSDGILTAFRIVHHHQGVTSKEITLLMFSKFELPNILKKLQKDIDDAKNAMTYRTFFHNLYRIWTLKRDIRILTSFQQHYIDK